MRTVPHLRFVTWTFIVVSFGTASSLSVAYQWPSAFGRLTNPRASGRAVDALFLFYTASTAACVVPAFVGYLLAVFRTGRSYPERVIPRRAVSTYSLLCGAIVFTLILETMLYDPCRLFPGIGDGFLRIVLALSPALFPMILVVWSIVIGLRLGRIGKVARHMSTVCGRCGFAVLQDSRLPCPVCGGEVCTTQMQSGAG